MTGKVIAVDWTKHGPKRRKRVGIWIRVSTEDQAQGESPEHHETRARLYAEAKGWEVVTVYDLSAVSGKSVMGHSEARRMRSDVREAAIAGLIFSKLARLARNTQELLECAEYFQEHDADLISLAESIDTSTPAGRFFYTLLAGLAQWEREEITERIKASVVTRAKMGKSLGGAAPFGYAWENRVLVLEPDEAAIRREMFELFATHRRIKVVTRMLNEAGYRTRKGGIFRRNTVRRLLEDPIAKGKRRVNYTRSLGEGRHWELKPESEWEWHEVPRIVSDELFDEVNAVFASWKKNRKPAKRVVHLFSGLAFCNCGMVMYVPSGSKKYVCKDCRNKIPIDVLEMVFKGKLQAFLNSPGEVTAALEEGDRKLEEKRALLLTTRREEGRVRAEMDKLYKLYLADEISTEGFGERNRPLEERLEQLRGERPRLEAEIDFLSIRHLSSAEVLAEAQTLYARWEELPFAERRSIVEVIVERIIVGTDEISIELLTPTYPSHTQSHTPSHPPSTKSQQNVSTSSGVHDGEHAETGREGEAGAGARQRRHAAHHPGWSRRCPVKSWCMRRPAPGRTSLRARSLKLALRRENQELRSELARIKELLGLE